MVWMLVKLLVVQLHMSNKAGCEMLLLNFNVKWCHSGFQWPHPHRAGKTQRALLWAFAASLLSRVIKVIFNGSAARTVLFLNSAGLHFTAQEAPECAPRMRAVQANREPSARRRGRKQGPNFSKGKHG